MIKLLFSYCLFGMLLFSSLLTLNAQSVTSLTLINSTTDTEIGPLSEGDIINLRELNGDAINVNANTNPATVGSVKFMLQGASFRTENVVPYALAGNSGANYADWRPAPGDYVLEAIPFTEARGQGVAGTSLTVNFTVVDQEPATAVPTAPSALAANVVQPGEAMLSWEDNSTNEASFLIEFTDEFNGNTGWEALTTVPANSTSYTDNTLGEQDYRYYRIAAINEAGSSEVSATIEVANLPYPPTDIIVSNVTSNSFDIRWTEPPFGNDYQIDVAQSENGNYEYFDAFYFGYTDFSYSGFQPATTYYFRMRTNFDGRPSDWSYFTVTTLGDTQPELPAVVRINAGGQEISYGDSVFIADTYFSGDGKSYSNLNVTNIANTALDALYLTERSTNQDLQSFSYAIPVTNGTYEIKLHFAEIYFGATGGGPGGSNKRVFSATLEGEPVLVNYDINAEVGAMTATVKTFSAQVDDQILHLNFTASANQPKVSAIEIYGEGSLINESALPAVVRINAGGGEVSYGDSVFVADTYFSGNGKSYSNSKITDIANTALDQVYLTERSTNQNLQSFGYNIPLTNGEYEVRLHFAEIYFGATGGGAGGSNKRVFSVTAEESPILTAYDINAQVGPMTAVVETFNVQVTDETLNLSFSASVNQPKVSAIEIYGEGNLREEPVACSWNDLAGSSLSKVEAQSAKVNGKLYVLAGFMAGLKITGATEIYDPATNTWSLGTPMPTPVTHMGAAVVGDEIWIVAGFVGNHPGQATDLVQIYNTTNDTWREGPALPNPRGSGAAAYANGKLHFFGGLLPDRRTDVGEHYVLGINNQAAGWQAVAPLPNPRNHLSAAAVDGKIYAIGGQYGHDGGVQDQPFLHEYNPQTDQWVRKADLPSARSHFEPGTEVHNGKVIIVGGRRGGFFFNDVTEYDPATDTWNERCQLPENLLAPAAKVFGDRLIVANGGVNGTCCPTDAVRWLPIEPEQTDEAIKVLVYHETNGFRHGSISAGIAAIEDLGNQFGWSTTASQSSDVFTSANLAQFDAVVWLNTSGNNLLTSAEQDAFEAYIQSGRGFVGVHAATDTYRDRSWPWYNDLVGGIVQANPNHTPNNTSATIDVVNSHPAVAHLGSTWTKNEEYYYWERNGGYLFEDNIHLLEVRSTGNNSYDAPRPVTWFKEYDGGRSFYTALGHNASDYQSNSNFRTMLKEAILWSASKSAASPSSRASSFSSRIVLATETTVMNAFPNPTRQTLTVPIMDASADNIYSIRLMSQNGTTHISKTTAQVETPLDITELPAGVYALIIQNGQSTQKQLIIKE